MEPAPVGATSKKKAARPRKPPQRPGTGLFGKAVLKEAIDLLPKLPDTDAVEEIRQFLRRNLHFNSEETRHRSANYIISRMFPSGRADASLRLFAKRYAGKQDLKEACFYRFMKAEPLLQQVTEDLLLPSIGQGRLTRRKIKDYLGRKVPGSRSIDTCATAIVAAYLAAGIVKADRAKITYAVHDIPLAGFAFILHSEFPEPGMYDLAQVDGNPAVRAMLWIPEQILSSLYELRNGGLISKISEIDNIRQFTTKWTLDQLVEHLVSRGERA